MHGPCLIYDIVVGMISALCRRRYHHRYHHHYHHHYVITVTTIHISTPVEGTQTATDPRPTLMNERTLSGSQYRKQQLTVDRKVSSMYCCNGDDIMMVIMMVIMMTT